MASPKSGKARAKGEAKADRITPKQEKFAALYVETGNASEAYRQAYDCLRMKPETIWREGCELLQNPKVATRIETLRAAHLKRHEITVDSLTLELEEARNLAKEQGTAAAMVSATLGKAKLHGLLIDKGELTGKGGAPMQVGVTALTPSKFEEIARRVSTEF
jgi:phage terminase small subunit